MIPSGSYMKYFFGGLLVGQIMRESNIQLEWFSCRNNRMNFNKFILHLYLIYYNFLLSGHYVTFQVTGTILPQTNAPWVMSRIFRELNSLTFLVMFTIQKKNKPVVLFYRSSVKSLLLLCFAVILIVYNEADLINSKLLKC